MMKKEKSKARGRQEGGRGQGGEEGASNLFIFTKGETPMSLRNVKGDTVSEERV